MRILQLCMRVPCPPMDGSAIAMYNLASSLLHGAQVKALALNPGKHYVDMGALDDAFARNTDLEAVDHQLEVTLGGALRNLFTRRSYHLVRYESVAFAERLAELLKASRFDIVQLEGLFMTPYIGVIRRHSDASIVLRAHNVEHVIWQRLAAGCRNPLKKAYLALLAGRMKREELAACEAVDAIVPITPVDRDLLRSLGCKAPMQVVPVGVDVDTYPPPRSPADELGCFHLGSMDWMPTIEGVDWFLDLVYPRLVSEVPHARVFLAGRRMPARILAQAGPNLVVMDRVEDARAFMSDKEVMIVPLLSGGGMRVKIIEGMAAGKAIVSTSVGAEGIECHDGRDILIADTPEAFCRALIRLYTEPGLCASLGKAARELAEARYANRRLGRMLLDSYSKLRVEGADGDRG